MKLFWFQEKSEELALSVPSTSGLRDETPLTGTWTEPEDTFQYPQPRVYAMKLPFHARHPAGAGDFQYPQPRVYAMKPPVCCSCRRESRAFQYPQPRVYAMKPVQDDLRFLSYIWLSVPSTSGLRDETIDFENVLYNILPFQYPQPRVYAMKRNGVRR